MILQACSSTLLTALMAMMGIGHVMGDDPLEWRWTVSPALRNDKSCDISPCSGLYNRDGLATSELWPCFMGSPYSCVFNVIGDPQQTQIPVTCPGSATTRVASLNIAKLIPPFGDNYYSNGSAIVTFESKPTGSRQCDFYTYVDKAKTASAQCTTNIDDYYWVPDAANGVTTVMTKSFELSLYKLVKEGVTGYYIESENWVGCGDGIANVAINSGLRLVVSMAGEIGKTTTTTPFIPPYRPTTTTIETTVTTQTPSTTYKIETTPRATIPVLRGDGVLGRLSGVSLILTVVGILSTLMT